MTDAGVEVGGTIAVDTEEMLRAASVLGEAGPVLGRLAARASAATNGVSAPLAASLADAASRLLAARREADRATEGLRVAALRYGWAERGIAQAQQTLFAAAAAAEGTAVRLLGPAGVALVAQAEVTLIAAPLLAVIVAQWRRTGRVDLQSDPLVIRWLQLRIASLDDGLRGWLEVERPVDLLVDRPDSTFGTAQIAALLAAAIWPASRGPIAVERRTTARVARPRSIVELADRLPDGAEPAGQIRIERYDDAGGPRWIVYSAGTVTFDIASGDEPFDLESNVRGVGDGPTDAQRAVLEAMRQAGVGADDPVLLVGHSQGALNALRIAEDGPYRVAGVVQFGGPTAQIPAPPNVPVLAVEHPQDLVPALGGVAAVAPGTVRITRSLPDGGRLPGPRKAGPIGAFPAHDMRNYRETVRQAEALQPARLRTVEQRWSGFLQGGEGIASRYRARRDTAVVSGPAPAPTGGAAPVPPASR